MSCQEQCKVMDTTPHEGQQPKQWPVLDIYERRVLGVLVEKAKTTPDAYPLSMNAIMTGSNQKSNRDPQMQVDDLDVEAALQKLQELELVSKIVGMGRVERWKHHLYDEWKVGKVDLAILAELMLRGPQTEGELRGRANRMEEIPDLDMLREHVKALSERKLVIYLTPEGRRGTMVTHGFHETNELASIRKRVESGSHGDLLASSPAPSRASVSDEKVTQLQTELAEARQEIAQLRAKITELTNGLNSLSREVGELRSALGG